MPDFIHPIRELVRSAFGPLPGAEGRRRPSPRRLLVMALFLPLLLLALALHWLALLLDEVLFPGYREVPVEKPLFVVGPPRSGTTFLHALLALDDRFTTFSAWECVFAPSVTQRKAILALATLDGRIGRPFGRALGWLTARLARFLDEIHPIDLGAPEEDYLALLPMLGAFVLAVPFSTAEGLWDLAQFDRAVAAPRRRRLLRHYRRALQKHLYVHGAARAPVLLSKNASFAPLLDALLETFPDARLVCCLRDPLYTLPSQLSAIGPAVRFFDSDPDGVIFPRRVTESLRFYYDNLFDRIPCLPTTRHAFVEMDRLQADPEAAVRELYRRLRLPLPNRFARRLAVAATAARGYRSRHRYALEDFGLDELSLRRAFAAVYARWPGCDDRRAA